MVIKAFALSCPTLVEWLLEDSRDVASEFEHEAVSTSDRSRTGGGPKGRGMVGNDSVFGKSIVIGMVKLANARPIEHRSHT